MTTFIVLNPWWAVAGTAILFFNLGVFWVLFWHWQCEKYKRLVHTRAPVPRLTDDEHEELTK